MQRTVSVFLGIVLTLSILLIPNLTNAQDKRCFEETGYCISGPIREYWEANGGLPVFGYPITAQAEETVEDWTGPVQWFERDRLEDHGRLGVMAGRLGARILELNDTPWQTFETVEYPEEGCRYFSETRHSMCEPFLSYWEQNGGLQRFGYPVTEEFTAIIGEWEGTIQYFERRRMEHHEELAGTQYEVLLGLLGNELKQREGGSGVPYPAPDPEETETAAPEETETAAPEETETAAPEETETAAPEETETAAPGDPGLQYQAGICLSPREDELAGLINDYRGEYGLPAVPVSKSLSHVAQMHVVDLHENNPDSGTDARGVACNLHSWSDQGDWTPVCYTSDHEYAEHMWNKPEQITNGVYTGSGFEIASYSSSESSNPLDGWKNSPSHNNVIIEADNWGEWNAMGVGYYHGYAVVWFGRESDPQGTMPVCE